MEEFYFNIKTIEDGWLFCTIGSGNNNLDLSISYLCNPLYELLDTLEGLHDEIYGGGSPCERFAFDWFDEPTGYYFDIKIINPPVVCLKISTDKGVCTPSGEDSTYSDIMEFECNYDEMLLSVLIQVTKTLNRYGLSGYRQQWGMHEFPFSQYIYLLAAIMNQKACKKSLNHDVELIKSFSERFCA